MRTSIGLVGILASLSQIAMSLPAETAAAAAMITTGIPTPTSYASTIDISTTYSVDCATTLTAESLPTQDATCTYEVCDTLVKLNQWLDAPCSCFWESGAIDPSTWLFDIVQTTPPCPTATSDCLTKTEYYWAAGAGGHCQDYAETATSFPDWWPTAAP